MRTPRGPRLALLLLFACAACAAPRLRVDKEVLDKITIEHKLLLFDAENELNIAVDSRDQVVDEIEQMKEDIRRAKKKLEVAARDQSAFEDKGDAERAKIAGFKAISEEARIEWLKAKLEWARARLDQERAKLIVARAKFELAKAQLVKKNNVPGASDIDLADFEEQVKGYEEDVVDYDEDIAEAAAEVEQAEQTWLTASNSLKQASGGALGSRWLD